MNVETLKVVFLAALIVCICGVGNAGTTKCSHETLEIASDSLLSSDEVEVSTVEVDSWDGTTPADSDDNIYFSFMPKNTIPKTAFIFLPGGNSDPVAYAPAAHQMAAEGYLIVIVPMPGCISMPFGQNRAGKIISDFENIQKWVIGGHSVGAVSACFYASDHDDIFDGVIIWASIPPIDISSKNLKVLTVYGSEDGRATPESVDLEAEKLPEDTIFVEIEGGNHTQFAYYDTAPDSQLEGDNPATINLEEQQEIIVNATVNFLYDIGPPSTCPAADLLGRGNPQLNTIRQFRDKVMEKNPLGRKLIDLYYKNGDIVISILKKNTMIRKFMRVALESLVPIIGKLLKD